MLTEADENDPIEMEKHAGERRAIWRHQCLPGRHRLTIKRHRDSSSLSRTEVKRLGPDSGLVAQTRSPSSLMASVFTERQWLSSGVGDVEKEVVKKIRIRHPRELEFLSPKSSISEHQVSCFPATLRSRKGRWSDPARAGTY